MFPSNKSDGSNIVHIAMEWYRSFLGKAPFNSIIARWIRLFIDWLTHWCLLEEKEEAAGLSFSLLFIDSLVPAIKGRERERERERGNRKEKKELALSDGANIKKGKEKKKTIIGQKSHRSERK